MSKTIQKSTNHLFTDFFSPVNVTGESANSQIQSTPECPLHDTLSASTSASHRL